MRGVTFLGGRKLAFADFPDPAPGPHDVVIAVKASGMCGSDLHPYRATGDAGSQGLGKASGPVIAGHEPCGVVAAAGDEYESAGGGTTIEQAVQKLGGRRVGPVSVFHDDEKRATHGEAVEHREQHGESTFAELLGIEHGGRVAVGGADKGSQSLHRVRRGELRMCDEESGQPVAPANRRIIGRDVGQPLDHPANRVEGMGALQRRASDQRLIAAIGGSQPTQVLDQM